MSRRRTTVLARLRPYAPALLVLFSASCFEYGAAPNNSTVTGRDVRITLTTDARTTLASRIGTQVRAIDGIARSSDSSRVLLSMNRTLLTDGSEAAWTGDTVSIPTSDIAVLERRKMAPGRTLALVAIIAGVTAAVALSIGLTSSSSQSGSATGGAK